MPAYPWLFDDTLETTHTAGKIITLRRLGVPYPDGYERDAVRDLKAQADRIAASLNAAGQDTSPDREIVALIAYLQRLGTDIKPKTTTRVLDAGGR
jgi:cytochrome c oxidase cbb3-type subunit I/II